MATITAGVVTPVAGGYSSTAYSGNFIPTLWSAKLNAKFYATSVFADICNRNWEGDISNLGDKVIINEIPSLTINDYVVGGNLSYQTPAPSTIELVVDRAKYFGFNVNDVMEYQSKPNLMSMFTDDAAEQMRTVIDSTCLVRTFYSAHANNIGATAGIKSAGYNLGTAQTPVDITSGTLTTLALRSEAYLQMVLNMAAVLDEQNIPESDRFIIIPPIMRTALMNSTLGLAYATGDSQSPIRNGKIGRVDRFDVYVSNQLPYAAANGTTWTSGDGSETTQTITTNASKRYVCIAGHRSAFSFASQMSKTETLRNPTDFGDLVRGLQIFGHKTTKPEACTYAVWKTA